MDCTLAAECSSEDWERCSTLWRPGTTTAQRRLQTSRKTMDSHWTGNSRKFMTIELNSVNSLHVFPIISLNMMLYKSGTGQERTTNTFMGTFCENRFVL